MQSFSMPSFRFSPNPLDPASPMLHLDLYDPDSHSFYEHRMPFREAFEFTARLSQEVAAIALRSPELRRRVTIKDVDMEPPVAPTRRDAQQPASPARRGVLARILGRE